MVVREAPLEQTEAGLAPAADGWFVLNAREACRLQGEGVSASCELEGAKEFPQVGVFLRVLGPGEPIAMYHWEADQEDFWSCPARRFSSSRARSDRCGSGTSSKPGPYREGWLPA